MLTATLLTLIILPALYSVIENQRESYKGRKALKVNGATMTLIVLAVAFIPFSVNSQNLLPDSLPQLTAEEAGARAVQHYPRLHIQQLQIEREKALLPSAKNFGTTEIYTRKDEHVKRDIEYNVQDE